MHNLDSQIADFIAQHIPWILTIHDAFLVSPIHAKATRKLYGQRMEHIHNKRESILNNYFKSIRLSREAIKDWHALTDNIVPVEGQFQCDPMTLK